MRILVAPRPCKAGGPFIFLFRVVKELSRRGYAWTAFPFHYTGLSLMPWDYAMMMNCPRNMEKILRSGKPVITTMGQPFFREWCEKMNEPYLQEYEREELLMIQAIIRSDKIVFISNYVKTLLGRDFPDERTYFPEQ